MRNPAFCICENKDADQQRSNGAADQRLCFAIRVVQCLYYLYQKFQASSHILWLYSPVCVGPGRKPRRQVFSQRGSNIPMISFAIKRTSVINFNGECSVKVTTIVVMVVYFEILSFKFFLQQPHLL